MLARIKKILRRNPQVRKAYYYGKKVLVLPLKITPLRPIANTTFPLKEIFNFRKNLLFAAVKPYTLLGYKTLSNAYDLARDIEKKNLTGAFVECGTWKGGCAAVMAWVAHRFGERRVTWYFDSFEGMPPPSVKDARGAGKKGDVASITGDVLKASVSDVEEVVFKRLGLPKNKNRIIKGWFSDTVPRYKKEIGSIAILRLDGDWYESTKVCLEELYDQVIPGGYVIIDDYGAWEGARRAVHDFRDTYDIIMDFKFIGTRDPAAYKMDPPVYFQKVTERKK